MLFSEIPGLEGLKTTLTSSVKNNHIAHAQLFTANEGSASLALALSFATYIMCEERTEEDACGKCASCIKANKLVHPDLHFVFPYNTTKNVSKDPSCAAFMKEWREFAISTPYGNMSDWGNQIGAENKQLNISAEEARNILKTISLKAFESPYKILIIWMAEQMNATASNAILKILEEPPEKTVFILINDNLEKILPTILSRTQIFRIRPFTDKEVNNFLVEKHMIEPKKATQLSYLADGNINKAIQLISEVEEGSSDLFSNWLRSCYKKNVPEMINFSESFQKMTKESQKNFFQYGLKIIRETLICRYANETALRLNEENLKFIKDLSKILSHTQIEVINKEFNDAAYHLERNANARITFLDVSLSVSSILRSN